MIGSRAKSIVYPCRVLSLVQMISRRVLKRLMTRKKEKHDFGLVRLLRDCGIPSPWLERESRCSRSFPGGFSRTCFPYTKIDSTWFHLLDRTLWQTEIRMSEMHQSEPSLCLFISICCWWKRSDYFIVERRQRVVVTVNTESTRIRTPSLDSYKYTTRGVLHSLS